jgi:hypothetical protein
VDNNQINSTLPQGISSLGDRLYIYLAVVQVRRYFDPWHCLRLQVDLPVSRFTNGTCSSSICI